MSASVVDIVKALSRAYTDEGVVIVLTSPHMHFGAADAPGDVYDRRRPEEGARMGGVARWHDLDLIAGTGCAHSK